MYTGSVGGSRNTARTPTLGVTGANGGVFQNQSAETSDAGIGAASLASP